MSLPLFVADPLPVLGQMTLTGDEGHHAARVQRLKVGEQLLLTNGRGGRAQCIITAVNGSELSLAVQEVAHDTPPSPKLVVVQALPKGDRGELAVELMTELGVDEIVPWAASRCITQWRGPRGEKALAKWRNTAKSAAKQSRRTWFPVVSELVSTAQVARVLAQTDHALVLHESAKQLFVDQISVIQVAASPTQKLLLQHQAVSSQRAREHVVIVVGPEGGIDDHELEKFTEANAHIVRFGQAVLRTSTAGAAALAVLAAYTDRWR